MYQRIERFASIVLTIAAIVVAAVVVRRELGGRVVHSDVESGPPVYIQDWQALSSAGRWIGDSTAPIRIVEFSDFECPYCAQFQKAVLELRSHRGRDVAVLFVHFPLGSHRFAQAAARAAECGAEQGKFPQVHDALFAKQDSFGLRSWVAYATDAGIIDTAAFQRCTANTLPMDRVLRGKAAGTRLRVDGTPTVIINGWRYSIAPFDSLAQFAERSLGKHSGAMPP